MVTFTARIADWTLNPGLRYTWQGDYTAQEYLQSFLLEAVKTALNEGKDIVIDLDGPRGYASSFIDEIFGQLSKNFGLERVLSKVTVKSYDRPWLIEEAKEAMQDRSHT